ncbi:MAG: hypothetical protein WC071_10145 [Victivallaceae bacterium]
MTIKNKTLAAVVFIPLTVALAARLILLIFWWNSPVRYYSYVVGLDMPTILTIGGWLYHGFSVFTLYKFTIAMTMVFNHGHPCPEAIIIIQMLLGSLLSVIIAWITLRLTGKRLWAATAGTIAALYAPELIYESLILKETYMTFFSALALAGVLWGRKKHCTTAAMYISGILLALPCLVRVTAFPFCVMGSLWILWYALRKLRLKDCLTKKIVFIRTAALILGIATLLGPATIFNRHNTARGINLPFYVGANYAISLGSVKNATSMNVPESDLKANSNQDTTPELSTNVRKIFELVVNLLRKTPLVFNAYEIPNNVNYYFMKYKLPVSLFFGPFLLIPLAVSALILIIITGKFIRRESILLLFIFSFLLPICFFYPLARYRLVLMPVFCVLAPYSIYYAINFIKRKKTLLAVLPFIILYAAVCIVTFPYKAGLRSTDFIAYGKALEKMPNPPENPLIYYRAACEIAPANPVAVINYTDSLLKNRQPKTALQIIMPFHQKNPAHSGGLYYAGLTMLCNGYPAEAENIFNKINIEQLQPLRSQYYFYLAETLRLQKKYPDAKKIYAMALEAAVDQKQKNIIQHALDSMPEK